MCSLNCYMAIKPPWPTKFEMTPWEEKEVRDLILQAGKTRETFLILRRAVKSDRLLCASFTNEGSPSDEVEDMLKKEITLMVGKSKSNGNSENQAKFNITPFEPILQLQDFFGFFKANVDSYLAQSPDTSWDQL